MKERAREYFLLADQYLETAKLTLNILIENGNSNFGIGETEEEAEEKMLKNNLKSDSTLLIPTIFNVYQSIELFLKGLLLLNNKEITGTHEIDNMITELKDIYGNESNTYKKINNFYKVQIEIVKKFRSTNNITTTKELYESLRYPENNAKKVANKKFYNYMDLKYNYDFGIENFKLLRNKIQEVKDVVLIEYKNKY